MKRIAVDMDGVLADVYSQFIQKHKEEENEWIELENTVGLTEAQAFPHLLKHVNSPGFFRNAPLVHGCQEVMKGLNEKFQLFIVSAAMEFPLSLGEKQAWLYQYFPYITWKQIVFCGSKEIIKADIMIDDHFKNLDSFEGKTILFTQPHNELADAGRHRRVFNWMEIGKLLLP